MRSTIIGSVVIDGQKYIYGFDTKAADEQQKLTWHYNYPTAIEAIDFQMSLAMTLFRAGARITGKKPPTRDLLENSLSMEELPEIIRTATNHLFKLTCNGN